MIDINKALGMVSERPLQVGDWVVAIDPNPEWPMAENMDKPMRVIDIVRRFGWDCLVLEGQKENPWVPYKFRRIDPPRDEVAEVKPRLVAIDHDPWTGRDTNVQMVKYDEHQRVVSDLKEQLATVTRKRDERPLPSELATVQAELKQAHEENYQVWNDLNLPCIVDPIAKDPNCIDCTLSRSYQAYLLLRGLPQLQAEAAAMRRAIDTLPKPSGSHYGDPRYSSMVTSDVIKRCRDAANCAAGRELLDELRRKDERIRELQERVDELDAECASFADQAYDAAEPEEMSEAEINAIVSKVVGEQSPVWQYRWREPYAILYRGNESGVFQKLHSGSWQHSGTYDNWQACCDDPATYPCDENGKRIEEVKMPSMEELDELCTEPCKEWRDDRSFADEDYDKRIADLERQLSDHKRDAELCRDLRAFLLDQMEVIKGCVVAYKWLGNDTLTAKLNDLMVAIHDGGAK